uniref:Uncharacterized protein n=1 Tax=Physcomitrium patens TaxID=3218 RepID=A0A2K1JEB4_PHYPA|nr:hypothetical protein PHYPA_020157 [Physcomitrium patens]
MYNTRKTRVELGSKLVKHLKKRWYCQRLFCSMVNGNSQWVLSSPIARFVFQPPYALALDTNL